MSDTTAAKNETEGRGRHTDYRRFIILGGARVGSHMLASSLNSSEQIICFREVLNAALDSIQYGVDGYDESSAQDKALRASDPSRFLSECIFSAHPSNVRAVGFKFHYAHAMSFPGALKHLRGDSDLHVVHLRRRNVLRMFVSWKLAQRTGMWLKEGPQYTQGKLQKALRDPAIVLRKAKQIIRPVPPPPPPPKQITIDTDELYQFAVETALKADHFEQAFSEHERLDIYYEDLLDRRDETHDVVQRFLSVEPERLSVNTAQQHPMPVRELIANYDEVRERFLGHPDILLDD